MSDEVFRTLCAPLSIRRRHRRRKKRWERDATETEMMMQSRQRGGLRSGRRGGGDEGVEFKIQDVDGNSTTMSNSFVQGLGIPTGDPLALGDSRGVFSGLEPARDHISPHVTPLAA